MPITSGTIARTGGGGFTNPLTVPLQINANNVPLVLDRSTNGNTPNYIAFQTAGVTDWKIGENHGINQPFGFVNAAGATVFQIPQTALASGSLLKMSNSQGLVAAAVPGTDYVIPSQLTGFIQNQNASPQTGANAWIDGEWVTSNADSITVLSPGFIAANDISGGSASWSIFSASSATLGAYWVLFNGSVLFNNQVGAGQAPVIPTDMARLNELQLPYGTLKAQTGAITVTSISTNAIDSLYEVISSINWLLGGTGQLELEVLFTDVNGNAQNIPLYPMGQSNTSALDNRVGGGFPFYCMFPTVNIWAKGGTTITVQTVIAAAGAINYDVSALVRYLYQIP